MNLAAHNNTRRCDLQIQLTRSYFKVGTESQIVRPNMYGWLNGHILGSSLMIISDDKVEPLNNWSVKALN